MESQIVGTKGKYIIKQLIFKNPGHGRYIYKVQQVEDNQFYVLKKQSQMNDNERKLIEFSIKQPHQLQHLIQFYEIFTQAENECIISEYCSGGDLRAFMEKQSLKPDQIVMIVVDVCKALKELQAFSFYHRDIKPENIVISVDPFANKTKYKLIDYGELKMDSEKVKELGGTIKYTENTGTLNYLQNLQDTRHCSFSIPIKWQQIQKLHNQC